MKLKVGLYGVAVAGECYDDLCLRFVECRKEWRVVVNDKMRHEFPQDLRKEKEDVELMQHHVWIRFRALLEGCL